VARHSIVLAAAAWLAASAGAALAQGFPQPPAGASPVCQRLEGQLASINGGPGGDPRAEQIRRYEDASNRQQAELDRLTMQARRQGCEGSGFFSLFSGQPPQCGQINNQIQQMRGNLDQIMRNLEQVRAQGGSAQENQRRSVILALAQNNCGQQYVTMARGMQPQQPQGGFLGGLFGGGQQQAPGQYPEFGVPGSTFQTMCVRTCDGFYFPISFATSQARFADDERACRAQCPAADASLYTFRNPGEDMNQAVSTSTGQPYTALPSAFRYRQEVNPTCSCRGAGQSWADAMKHLDERGTLEQGDILVTDERAKQLSQPPKGRPAASPKGTPVPTPTAATPPPPATTPDPNRPIRSVGPPFLPNTQKN
jgi:hypothetical protein